MLKFLAELAPMFNALIFLSPLPPNSGAHRSLTAFRPADVLLRWDGLRATRVDTTVVSPIRGPTPVHFQPGHTATWAEGNKYKKHLTACNAAGYDFTASRWTLSVSLLLMPANYSSALLVLRSAQKDTLLI